MVSRFPVIRWLILCITLASCASPASNPLTPDSVLEGTVPPESSFLTPPPSTEAPPLPGISAEKVRNAKYQLGFTDALRIVQLSDGVYQQGAPGGSDYINVRVTDYVALGDIDGDHVNEAAALITESYGGSGVFVFLALFMERINEAEFFASVYVDDRPTIEDIGFENNEIFLSVVTHKKDEPMCCPTLRNERWYRLVNNQLDLSRYVTYTADGRARTIAIESPAEGTSVFNSIQIKGNVEIAPFENNLVYRIFDVGGVELAVGSITVNAADLGGPGTFDADISLGNILSGALIRLEVQDVNVEDGSLFAMDSIELVVE